MFVGVIVMATSTAFTSGVVVGGGGCGVCVVKLDASRALYVRHGNSYYDIPTCKKKKENEGEERRRARFNPADIQKKRREEERIYNRPGPSSQIIFTAFLSNLKREIKNVIFSSLGIHHPTLLLLFYRLWKGEGKDFLISFRTSGYSLLKDLLCFASNDGRSSLLVGTGYGLQCTIYDVDMQLQLHYHRQWFIKRRAAVLTFPAFQLSNLWRNKENA